MTDVEALVAELMRLREQVREQAVEAARERAQADAVINRLARERQTAATVDAMNAYTEGVAEGERRIVAYLRRETYPCCAECNNEIADYIERGDHLQEGA